MRTRVDIPDALLERAKRFAATEGKRLSDVVNDALLAMLSRAEQAEKSEAKFRMITFDGGGVAPGIDFSSNASIRDAQDEEFRDPVTGEYDLSKLR